MMVTVPHCTVPVMLLNDTTMLRFDTNVVIEGFHTRGLTETGA